MSNYSPEITIPFETNLDQCAVAPVVYTGALLTEFGQRIVSPKPILAVRHRKGKAIMSDENNTNDSQDKRGILPTENSPGNQQSELGGRMQTVKSAWDEAPEGAKKDNALKHYQSAKDAQKSGNDAEAMRELEEATRALS